MVKFSDKAESIAIVDTGATVSVISESIFKSLDRSDLLELKGQQLTGVDGRRLQLLGHIKLKFTIENSEFEQKFVVYKRGRYSSAAR